MSNKIKEFFWPNEWKILIFSLFSFIVFAGHTQTWAFSGKDAGVPKPIFYDILQLFPFFWTIWVFLLLPLIFLSEILVFFGGYNADFIMRGPYFLFIAINVVYFYSLSCLIVFFKEFFKPTSGKIIGTVLISILINLLSLYDGAYSLFYPLSMIDIALYISISLLPISYLISCLLLFIFHKLKGKKYKK